MFLFFFLIYLLLLFNFSFSYFKLHWFHPVILFVKLICTGHIVLSLGQSLLYCITPSSPLCMLSRVSRSTTPQCPLRLLCPWDSPGKNTQVGCHALLQSIFPTQGLNPGLLSLLHWQAGSLPRCHSGLTGSNVSWISCTGFSFFFPFCNHAGYSIF